MEYVFLKKFNKFRIFFVYLNFDKFFYLGGLSGGVVGNVDDCRFYYFY